MKKRILIIDDEPAMLNAMKRDLRAFKERYEIYTSTNGEEALKLIEENAIDLLITDILMPEKEGIELITEAHKKFPLLKIIAMSGGGAIGSNSYLNIAKKVGSSYSLNKPFSRDELLLAVESLL